MFDKLSIRNFQSIAAADIKLGKITVIIGPSYRGKSAVVRALRTLSKNRFESSFMKAGTAKTTVSLSEGDTKVDYIRDASTKYVYSKNPEPFIKIGRLVPQEIQDFLNMEELTFDQDLTLDLNIQRQFDPPFMLGASGFELAKIFGKILNLDMVLAASRDISRDTQNLNRAKDTQNAIIDMSVRYIQDHYSVELQYSLLQEAIALDSEADAEVSQLEALESLFTEFEQVQATIQICQSLLSLLETERIDSFEVPPIELGQLIDDALAAEAELAHLEVQLSILKELPEGDETLGELESSIVQLLQAEALVAACEDASAEIDELFKLAEIFTLAELVKDGNELNSSFTTLRADYMEVMQSEQTTKTQMAQFIQANHICPLAGIPFTDECIRRLEGA